MEKAVVISKSVVLPRRTDQQKPVRIDLTPFDFAFFRADYPQRGVIFPKPDPDTDAISRLKASLSVALAIFYPLVGRLVQLDHGDGTASFHIHCGGCSNGVEFVHAVAQDVTVNDVLGLDEGYVPDFIKWFFPANGIKSYQGVSKPLLAVQVTELKDGVFLGWGRNHLVADGFSSWDFFNTWSEICSGHGENFPPLRLREWYLDHIDHPIRIPISETKTCSDQDVPGSPFLREKMFRFTNQNISKLKAKASEEIGRSDLKVSSFQAVVGHMWRSIVRQSRLNREKEVRCKIAVGLRQRLNLPAEKECFGNMVGLATAVTTAGELLEHGIGWAALRINETVRSQTSERIRILAESWMKNIKIQDLGVSGNGMDCDTLLVAGSPRFNVYGSDFGWGKPIAVRAGPGILGNGKIMIFPGVEEGSIDCQICLSSDIFVKLLADEEFLENVTIV